MSLLRGTLLMALALLLGGCAVPMRVGLTPEHRAKLTELKAHVVVVQDEVIATVETSNVSLALGGGLIGAMIDSSIINARVKASQDVMGSFYASIEDVDYRKEFNEAIQREFANYPLKIMQFTMTPRRLSQAEITQLRNDLQPQQALLVVYPSYYLTADFRSLDAETIVSMWIKDGTEKPIQRGELHYQSQPVGPGGTASIALWSAQNAATFRNALRESVAETISLLRSDIEPRAPDTAKTVPTVGYPTNTGEIKGQLVKETDTRRLVLGADQKMHSLPKVSTATASAAL